jgi:hypothetical protein
MQAPIEYCRKSRDKSISPSISFDSSHNRTNLTEPEKKEKQYYNYVVYDMVKEIFLSYDDLIRNINYNLSLGVKNSVKRIPEDKWQIILNKFFDEYFPIFNDCFDQGEYNCSKALRLEHCPMLSEYIKIKNKKKNRITIYTEIIKPNDNNNALSAFNKSPFLKYEENRKKLADNLKENLKLRMELALERRIALHNAQNIDRIKEKFNFIDEQIKNKPDMSYIDKNIDIMSSKLKMMKREISQFN